MVEIFYLFIKCIICQFTMQCAQCQVRYWLSKIKEIEDCSKGTCGRITKNGKVIVTNDKWLERKILSYLVNDQQIAVIQREVDQIEGHNQNLIVSHQELEHDFMELQTSHNMLQEFYNGQNDIISQMQQRYRSLRRQYDELYNYHIERVRSVRRRIDFEIVDLTSDTSDEE